ncbi:MAG: hypothetical protein UY21_C0010G0029 [Microgenomates group bacterium GW2011_GWA1_48_10]|nr:MAG: hypothetical protein UY21_C0010G0029 [Microgenomates group bacterium GW2011_GWA1_48_10]OHA94336.1 MAG: hypothetical protein A3B88_04465 [Candidatus Zambryskibacteria bacterium RIFCSPHIGHO2_02_FULL_39_19]
MKINVKKLDSFDKSTQQLIKLLEHNIDFEVAVWTARANLGIKPSNLLHLQELPDDMKGIFEKEWQEREPNLTVDEIHQITAPLDNLPHGEFERAVDTQNGQEIMSKVGLEEHKFEERLFLYSTILLDGFLLPKSWVYPIANLLRQGVFATFGSTEPFSIYVNDKWLRKRGVKGTNFTNLIPYIAQEPQGVQIVISTKIKHKNEFTEWLEKNWNQIQRVMKLTELPDYWSPNLKKLDQTVGIIELQQQYPEKTLGQIIELYEENLPEILDSSNESIKQEIKQFREYVQRLTIKARKNF